MKARILMLLLAGVALARPLPLPAATLSVEPSPPSAEEEAGRKVMWQRIVPELQKVRELEDRRKTLPRWAIFRTDQSDNREQINRTLDEAVSILSDAPAGALRRQMADLQASIQADRKEISALRERRLAAPEQGVLRTTVADIDARMEGLQARVAEQEAKVREIQGTFREELAWIGLDLTREQTEFLLATVIGDTVIDISIAFHNVRHLTSQLETLTAENQEDIQLARRYYGMYTALLRMLSHIYDTAIREIDQGYLPEMEQIRTRTQELMKQTSQMAGTAADNHRPTLQANLRSQEFTLRAADMYRGYLEEQRASLREAKTRIEKDLAVAMNTYETVQLSGDLLSVMRSSQELFNLMFEMEVPDLRPFENVELRREFDKLTDRLRQQEAAR